ncbi:MAG TPA: hypothetical protein VFT69_07825 [Pseudolabrys sp.]|jgi:hypothetical protein|nr:hypothetical protein [Pseudolabrys sp.]
MRLLVVCLLAVALLSGSAPARAGDLANFNTAVETASAHSRAAIGYLRTGNTDLAGIEIDRLRRAWQKLTARFAGHPPDAFEGNPLYQNLFTSVSARLAAADMMLSAKRPQAARQALDGMQNDLHALRQASGIVVLADCVADANKTMNALMTFDKKDLDWSKPQTRYGIIGQATVYGHTLDRCESLAGDAVRKNPDFRRLVDGIRNSLAFIPQAVAKRDTGLLHRMLIELRAFDNLLAFNYG